MNYSVDKLDSALDKLQGQETGGVSRQDKFVGLSAQSKINAATGKLKSELRNPYYYAQVEFANLLAIAFRLEWQKVALERGELDKIRWTVFVEADIYLFHIQLRAIFDYLARIIVSMAHYPGQVKGKDSFNKLRIWVKGKDRTLVDEKLGSQLAAIVEPCDWFDDVRDLRDGFVHRGRNPMLVSSGNKIHFLITAEQSKSMANEVMYASTIVHFERYAGLCIGYLIDLMDKIGEQVLQNHKLKDKSKCVYGGSPEYPTVRRWIYTARITALHDKLS